MKINDIRHNILGSSKVEKVQSINKEAAAAQQGESQKNDQARRQEKINKVKELKQRDLDKLKDEDNSGKQRRRRRRRRRREKDKDKKDLISYVYTKLKKWKIESEKGKNVDIKT